MKVGNNSVVIGNVPSEVQVGENCVVIGSTDALGNTILNKPMAVGFGAKAGADSIAIGAYAGAGIDQPSLAGLEATLRQLADMSDAQQNSKLSFKFRELIAAINEPTPDKITIRTLWKALQALADIDGAQSLLEKISQYIPALFN